MNHITIAGHSIEFADCHELGQGGPDTCTMSINGKAVVSRPPWGQPHSLRFHPSPLAFNGDILVPLWSQTRLYLVRIDPRALVVRRLTWWGQPYMRLLKVVGDEVEFATWHDARETRKVRLR